MYRCLRVKKGERIGVLLEPMNVYVWEEDIDGVISGHFPDGKFRYEVKNSAHLTGGYYSGTGFVPYIMTNDKKVAIQLDNHLFMSEADAVNSLLRKGFGLEDACLLIETLTFLK